MNAIIVTVYDSVNSGSFWQARALKSALETFGYEVSFLERRKSIGASSSTASVMLTMAKSTLKYGISAALRYKKISEAFQKANQQNHVISEMDAHLDPHNVFILGSDTIWNVAEKYFADNWDIFWGKLFNNHIVFPYAASIGNTSFADIQKIEGVKDAIKTWKSIGVRDKQTKAAIEELSDRQCTLVCDPTLLFDESYYTEKCGIGNESGYIFLYLFSRMDDEESKSLVQFAREKNLKIIIGSSHVKPNYCDDIILNTPHNFIRYMQAADYVVTDTYHGTVFSVNFNKRFISLDRGKNKVNEFLENVQLSERMKSNRESFSDIFMQQVDYHKANTVINALRQKSWEFLKSSLEKKL